MLMGETFESRGAKPDQKIERFDIYRFSQTCANCSCLSIESVAVERILMTRSCSLNSAETASATRARMRACPTLDIIQCGIVLPRTLSRKVLISKLSRNGSVIRTAAFSWQRYMDIYVSRILTRWQNE